MVIKPNIGKKAHMVKMPYMVIKPYIGKLMC